MPKDFIVISSDDEDPDVVFCKCTMLMKGTHLSPADAASGGAITLEREPANTYDTSAIMVMDLHGKRVGRLTAGTTAALAALLDSRDVHCVAGKINSIDRECPSSGLVEVSLAGPSSKKVAVRSALKRTFTEC